MPPPYTPVSAVPTAAWYGASLGLYGAQNIGRDAGGGGQHFTIIPLPAQPIDELTMQARADAIASTYSGLLMQAVDLYRLTVKRNGFMVGILWTMAHGFLGLPLTWHGDREMIAALTDTRDADGKVQTPGEFSRMHPENECAEIFSDGIGLGLGLGQYLLMCWRCDGIDWLRTAPPSPAHVEVETCKRCRARRHERPIGVRELYQLRWRDPRWLWRNTATGQWYYTGRQAMIPITPGDGEWLLFQTVPDQDIWIHGPWALGTEAAIFTRDGRYDMQAISATCAPTHVFNFTTSDPRARRDTEEQAKEIRFQNMLFLPGEVKHTIDAAQGGDGGYVGTADRITLWAQAQWEMAVTGIQQGTSAGSAFENAGVLHRVSRERRRFYAGAWIRQVVAQGLVWWARGNFGERPCPVGHIDTSSPEDRLADGKAEEQDGKALAALVEAYAAAGYELEPAYVEERAQERGVRVRPKASVAALPLGVEAIMACIRGGVALDSLGVGRFPAGDPRNEMTLVEIANAAKGGAVPASSSPRAPGPQADAAPGPPEMPAARIDPDEECDPDEDDDCDDAARLAAEYTAAGADRCPYHGRTHSCPRCGVRRVYGLDPETHAPRVAWRPIKAPRPVAAA